MAWEFVAALPDGLDTETGERGVQLSGGQRQRLGIARAFVTDPPMLVLDEPLSSLDSDNEHAVTEAMRRLRAGRTTMIVAHHLPTVRSADRIVVLEGGRLMGTGTHQELMGDQPHLCRACGVPAGRLRDAPSGANAQPRPARRR